MQLPQAIYGSTDRGTMRGYQLLGRSPGIDDRVAKEFCRWAPSHGALQSDACDAASLNFFPWDNDTFVISRSIYGGPEYSDRGGMEVVTIGLFVLRSQLAGYDNNPIALARTAIALGHLILPCSFRSSLLSVKLPRRSLNYSLRSATDDVCDVDVERTRRLLETGQRVVILGVDQPECFVDHVFQLIGARNPAQFSFSTALQPSASRDFRLQFLTAADHITIRQLESNRQVTCLRAGQTIGS